MTMRSTTDAGFNPEHARLTLSCARVQPEPLAGCQRRATQSGNSIGADAKQGTIAVATICTQRKQAVQQDFATPPSGRAKATIAQWR